MLELFYTTISYIFNYTIFQFSPLIYIATTIIVIYKFNKNKNRKLIEQIEILTYFSIPIIYYVIIWHIFTNKYLYTQDIITQNQIHDIKDIAFIIKEGDPVTNKLYYNSLYFNDINLNYNSYEIALNQKKPRHTIKKHGEEKHLVLESNEIQSRYHLILSTTDPNFFGISSISTTITDSTDNSTLFKTTEYSLQNLATSYAARFLSHNNKYQKERISYKKIDNKLYKYIIDPEYRAKIMLPKIISAIFPDMHKFDYDFDGFAFDVPTDKKWHAMRTDKNSALLMHANNNCSINIYCETIKFEKQYDKISSYNDIIKNNIHLYNNKSKKINSNSSLSTIDNNYIYSYNSTYRELHNFTEYYRKSVTGFATPHQKIPQTAVLIETHILHPEILINEMLFQEAQRMTSCIEVEPIHNATRVFMTTQMASDLMEPVVK